MDTNNSPSQKPRRIIEGRETRDEYLSEDRTKSRCRNKQKERDKIRLLGLRLRSNPPSCVAKPVAGKLRFWDLGSEIVSAFFLLLQTMQGKSALLSSSWTRSVTQPPTHRERYSATISEKWIVDSELVPWFFPTSGFSTDLYDPIEGDSTKPKDKDDKAWERTNRKTIGLIRQWIDNSIYHHVAQETNAKDLWDKLTNLYARKTPQNKAFLVKKLVHLRFQDGDIGASFHVTPHRDFFLSYTTGDYGYVRMGNGQSCKIVGIGDICLETELGCKLLLKKLRYVLEIRLNLISTGQLDDEGQ
ncbi:hypothetical protein CRG98_012099 [Punica granatum]|uniref:Retrovirus-related Pol polyprotein from transposon TNT 1-94-like beta-barrel domain-containing protein n=1 Tax=Punica granatum TaxID=22663 RepID=A0A2I0KG92_PUNGR|nr:hypothetical protein CRG98_012099 [Punica granatum]